MEQMALKFREKYISNLDFYTQPNYQSWVKNKDIYRNEQSQKFFNSSVSFLRNLLEDVHHENKGINQERDGGKPTHKRHFVNP